MIHGVSGLDGADLPEPGFEGDARHSVDFIAQTTMGSREPITLVPTGPPTNVALALPKEPGLARAVSRIVLMGGAVHDAVAHLVRPEVIKTRRMNVEIETAGELTRGRTVADVYGISGRKPNVDVALEVNQPLFKEMIFNAIKKLDAAR